ncbi:MAG: DNA replication/repair protein RecF [Actinomycetia bacterium]|nr:DNA replication/repair protein RecF [Actinomycetes bacterium]
MFVTALELVDFRSYALLQIDLEPGVSVLVGRNGQGKTNIVEAIGYLATLGSHRVASDQPLVRHGTERAVVRAGVERLGRRLLLEIEIVPGKSNRARINKSPLPRPRELLGALRAVVFAPEDLGLVRGDPDARRNFLDELMVQRTPRLAGVKADYDRMLKQRNALLKSAAATRRTFDATTLAVWNDHLVRLGSEVLEARMSLVSELGAPVQKAYADLAPTGGDAGLDYKASWCEGSPLERFVTRDEISHELRLAVERVERDELHRGVTLTGPHRDDLLLILGGHPAKGYASHGESWSIVLALRLASFELLRADGDDPVLILDDVFAELDSTRRDRLADMVGDAEQVLVTAAVAEDIPGTLSGSRYVLEAEQVRRER